MGFVLGTRSRDDGKIIFEVLVDQQEALQLKGHIENVHLFTEKAAENEVVITQRGTNDATTYLLVPKEMRNHGRLQGKAKCQRIDTKDKAFFIYTMGKKMLGKK